MGAVDVLVREGRRWWLKCPLQGGSEATLLDDQV